MAGLACRMLEEIVRIRSKGDPVIANTTRTKLILKGLNPSAFSVHSPDDDATLERVREAATSMGVDLGALA